MEAPAMLLFNRTTESKDYTKWALSAWKRALILDVKAKEVLYDDVDNIMKVSGRSDRVVCSGFLPLRRCHVRDFILVETTVTKNRGHLQIIR
jgi:hypothetical protein